MNNKRKATLIVAITLFSTIMVLISSGLNSQDDIHVVSQSENDNNEDINYETHNKEEETEKASVVSSNKDEKILKDIRVFVSGEVREPGVITIESDKRLIDAVDLSGGFTDEADLNSINLAMTIEDEKHYIIPKIGEEISSNPSNEDTTQKDTYVQEDTTKININTAEISELDELPGVGESTANKILNYREENGKFNSIEEIKNVNGIGDKKYEDIKDMISI